jgi:hypothetical protein
MIAKKIHTIGRERNSITSFTQPALSAVPMAGDVRCKPPILVLTRVVNGTNSRVGVRRLSLGTSPLVGSGCRSVFEQRGMRSFEVDLEEMPGTN